MVDTGDNTKRAGFWEKTDRWVTALTAIPILGIVLKKIFENIAEKGGDAIEKKIKKTLGINTDEAAKSTEDEILYNAALNAITDASEKAELNDFELALRKIAPKKAEAYILYVAKIVKAFEKERIISKSGAKKGPTDPKETTVIRDITDGVAQAKPFLHDVFTRTGPTPKGKLTARVAFLQGKGVFLLIPAEKVPVPAIEAAKKVARAAGEVAKKTGESIVSNQQANFADHQTSATAFESRAKERLEKAIKKRG